MNKSAINLHSPARPPSDPVQQWVTFRLDQETYGVNVLQVQEVLRVSAITPVPGAPDYVLGILNLRGQIVTVVDTRRLFHLPPREPDDNSRIVILEINKQIAGLLVDAVTEVVELRASQIESAPSVGHEQGEFVHGVHSRNGVLLILVDLNRLFSEAETQALAAL
jgi:purine-binding chemotaxis protein CheW